MHSPWPSVPQVCTTTTMTTCTCCFEAESVSGCSPRTWLLVCTRMVACAKCTRTVRSCMPGRCDTTHLGARLCRPRSTLCTSLLSTSHERMHSLPQAPVDADGTSRPLVAAWKRRRRAEAELAAAEAVLKAAPHSQVVAWPGHVRLLSEEVCAGMVNIAKFTQRLAWTQVAAQRVAAAEAVLDGDLDFALANILDDEDSEPDVNDQEQDPPSFSKVDLSLPDALLRKRFPGFPVRRTPCALCHRRCAALLDDRWRKQHMPRLIPLVWERGSLQLRLQGKAAAVVVDLEPGQMLYMPAG